MQLHYPLNPTTGVEDQTQLPWTNGFPATGQEGSYPPYQAVVFPMEELVNLITAAGITPSDADLEQVTEAIKALIAAAVKSYVAAQNGGLVLSGNGFELGFDNLPLETAFADADKIALFTEEAEDGLASGTPFAVTAAALAAYVISKIPPAPNPDNTLWHEGIIGGTAAALTTTLTPVPVKDEYGINLRLTVNSFTNAANATLDFGFGPKPIVFNSNNTALAGGEFIPNEADTIDIFYDGTRCRVMNIQPAVAQANLQSYVAYRAFSTSGTMQIDPACSLIEVIGCWGGGGGGGSGSNGSSIGAGGGGGGFAAGVFAVTPGSVLTINLGAGGPGATSGGASAGTGGTSAVVTSGGTTLCSASGGGGATDNTPGGGGGASAISSQLAIAGYAGTTGFAISGSYYTGTGGRSWTAGPAFSGGIGQQTTAQANGPFPGVGGGGGGDIAGPNGANGGAGFVIIKQLIGN